MRRLKASSSHLKNQTIKNLAKAALCILLMFLIFFVVAYRVLSTWQVTSLEYIALIFSLAPLIAFYYYLRKYHIYSGGWQGEKQVIKLLNNKLNNDYYLINALSLRNGGGDIDHIVLGPNGVFVLETKNWSGNITCNGDEWQRDNKRHVDSSPSRQLKRNIARIKQVIDSSPNLRQFGIWVEGIVVFTNKHAVLHINNPTVPILKLPQLANYIAAHKNSSGYSRQQLEAIGKEIIKAQH
ncbi:MAG: NERD domain-containing protein [Candidatus Bathyarchaeota archaeon]|nr:NERD domain-containing protein [Candidatus Bathyarchaeota archaeon]